MSESRETTLKDSAVELSPSTKRDSFHWPKYSLIVGTITTRAVKRVGLGRLPGFRGRRELARVLVERLGRGEEERGVRQHLAEVLRAVAVEIGGVLCGSSSGSVPQRAPSVRL